MRGVVFCRSRRLDLATFPDATPGPNEVVLEVKASGTCGSDLGYCRGAPGDAFAAFELRGPRELGLDPDTGIIAGHAPCGRVSRSARSWARATCVWVPA